MIVGRQGINRKKKYGIFKIETAKGGESLFSYMQIFASIKCYVWHKGIELIHSSKK